ncbi:MAG: DNA repair protein RecN [Chloroflexi bacterium]|nr:DNA repair protein RecN [Chloroflexota bacterium]
MLEEIRIQNFAIIDRLELTFDNGFNVITGETGAGKSIIIDAVDLLLGGKADGSFVRAGAEKAVVEGTFFLNKTVKAQVLPILQREEIEGDSDDYVTLAREVKSNGRSTIRINGVTTNTDVLKSIATLLVDVHGQSEHLSLLNPKSHIDLLDRYAELVEMRLALGALVDKVNANRREIKRLTEDEAALKRRADQLRREVEEIDVAALQPGEEDVLRAERTRMGNSEQLANLTIEAYALLHGDETSELLSAVDQLGQVSVLLGKLSHIDPDMKEDSELADELAEQAEELALTLRKYADRVEYNPERMEEVEERLELVNKLRRRYGATIEAVLEHADRARVELESIGNSDERLKELRAEEDKLLHLIGEVAERVSKVRVAIGKKMGDRIVAELADLRMEKAKFEVSIDRTPDPDGCFIGEKRYAFSHTGVDEVEFLMSANPGEPLRPLAKVASGGETARIMLALKRVLADADQTPTLIFDEIDTGIGGRVGSVVGEKLWALAATHQVMVVTHLAQLAGYGDKHYHVTKQVKGERTSTIVSALDEEERRITELAAMLGTEGESGKLSAQSILAQADSYKEENKPKAKKLKVDKAG